MFNPKTFQAHKQGIRENMEANLLWDTFHGTMKHKSSIETSVKYVEIKFDEEPPAVLGKMEFVAGMIRDGIKVDQYAITEKPYCTTYMRGVRYHYPVKTLRTEISDRQVTTAMRHLIHKKINTDVGQRVSNIDCRVMDLFKAGKIDWPTVIESHKGSCSL